MTGTGDTIRIEPRDGGWLVSTGDVPIGFLTESSIMAPSGTVYSVHIGEEAVEMRRVDGEAAVSITGGAHPVLTDPGTGTAWELRPGWSAGLPGEGTIVLDPWAAMARPYSLEEAQGTLPARAKLMLAWTAVRPAMVEG